MTVAEMEKGFQEIWALFKETDLKIKETDLSLKETDRILTEKFKETDRILTEKFTETDRMLEEKFTETDRGFKETKKEIDKAIKLVSDLTGKWGRFVEGLIVPAARRLFRERGIEVSRVYQRAKSRKDGEEMEIDVLAVDGEYVVLIEAKSTLKVEHVNEHIEKLGMFKEFFPEYKDKKAIGAVGGIVIEEGSDKYAYKKGLFVIVESGENVKLLNDEKFKPMIW
ncbi:MAG: DUF3782 domain-containing protein [bacterium]